MRRIILSLAALGILGFAAPYAAPAKAEDIVVGHRHGEDVHRHHHYHRAVIIKHDHD
jgi:hypothetical protein